MKVAIRSIILPLALTLGTNGFAAGQPAKTSPQLKHRSTLMASEGSSGRGGGFFQNSPDLLKRASAELANEIAQTPSALIADAMPEAWKTQRWSTDRFASVIRNVCQEQAENRVRLGTDRPLVMDYCSGDSESPSCRNPICRVNATDGQYISVLFPFFTMNENSPASLPTVENELLHEAVHLLGVGTGSNDDADAERLATRLLSIIHFASSCKDVPELCASQNWLTHPKERILNFDYAVNLGSNPTLTLAVHRPAKADPNSSIDCNQELFGEPWGDVLFEISGINGSFPDQAVTVKGGQSASIDLHSWDSDFLTLKFIGDAPEYVGGPGCVITFDLINSEGQVGRTITIPPGQWFVRGMAGPGDQAPITIIPSRISHVADPNHEIPIEQ